MLLRDPSGRQNVYKDFGSSGIAPFLDSEALLTYNY